MASPLGAVESGDQTCVTSINLGQKSPEQINKLQICVAMECFTVWCHMIMHHNHWSIQPRHKVTIVDNQPSQNRFMLYWPVSTCPPCLLGLIMVTCELWTPVVRANWGEEKELSNSFHKTRSLTYWRKRVESHTNRCRQQKILWVLSRIPQLIYCLLWVTISPDSVINAL